MCGHVNVPIHFNVNLLYISGHLPDPTVNYWLSAHAIMDSVDKYRVFGGHFMPKSLPPLTSDSRCSNLRAAIWWPQETFHIDREHVNAASQLLLNLSLYHDMFLNCLLT